MPLASAPASRFSLALLFLLSLPFLVSCLTSPRDADTPPVAAETPPAPAQVATLESMLNERIANPFDSTQTVSLFYATNRATQDVVLQCLDPFFSIKPGPGTRYGICRISVPVNREVGSLDEATEAGSDVHTTFRSLEHLPLTKPEFEAKLATQPEDALVFVHGFNVKFQEAAYRASQILFDTKFQGSAYLFSWPAGAPDRFLSSAYIATTYAENLSNAEGARKDFQEFITSLIAARKRIFLVVHSMGHQVVLPVLAALPSLAEPASGVPSGSVGARKVIQELVLNAPDFPADTFAQLTPALLKSASRITLYCSPLDNALLASSRLNKNARAGSCRNVPGLDVINVSNVDTPTLGVGGLGHGYYSGRPVVGDLSQVFLGLEAKKRLFIQKSFTPDREAFVLRK
ncbi:MAG: alpha/beta hydrolase [Silvanigrellales bacterium]|jgi:esterase/lipase superfamily enzyme|nr:alpha/beta hydrolase [Silvanigrellales bacterium]